MSASKNITAILLTFNEAKNLDRSLPPLAALCDQVYAVDSGSTDGTLEILEQHGVSVVHHDFENHMSQWQWALDHLPIKTEWLLCLDADQALSAELSESIQTHFENADPDCDGFYLCRKQIFQGQWIRYGGYYPKYLLKLFRKSKVVFDPNDLMDHHFYINGKTTKLSGDLIESNANEDDLMLWCEKHLRYAKRMADETPLRSGNAQNTLPKGSCFGNPDQRSLWSKGLWHHLPLYFRCFAYFLIRYVFLLGFLDGRKGLRFHLLQGLWYRLAVDAFIHQQKDQ